MRPAILRLGMLPPGLERPSNLLSMWYLYLCGTSEKRFFPKFAVARVSRPGAETTFYYGDPFKLKSPIFFHRKWSGL